MRAITCIAGHQLVREGWGAFVIQDQAFSRATQVHGLLDMNRTRAGHT